MSLESIFTGIAAILTAAGGIFLVVSEFRRRERRSMQGQINDLNHELESLQHDYLELRKFMMQISELLVAHGIEPPEVPVHES
ncbi:MAG: hypothetical protein ABWY25_06430 [Paenisporosarcina sp.]